MPNSFLHERSDFKALVATVSDSEKINDPALVEKDSPLRPPPGARRLAAARTGVSDCAGFAPNHKSTAVCHEPRFPSRPATLPRPPFCPLPRSGLFFPAAALVKKKTSRKRREREKQ